MGGVRPHWRTIDGWRASIRARNGQNRRYVATARSSTSGVSASIRFHGLIEAMPVELVPRRSASASVSRWSPLHNSEQFSLSKALLTVLSNKAMFWRHEALGVELRRDIDEIARTRC